MKKHIGLVLLASAVLAQMGCSRSSQYKSDQDFYREDSAWSNRKGSATSRAERFSQPKKKLLILPFLNVTPLGGDDLGEFAALELTREIRNLGRAVIPEDIRSADTSKDFYSGDKIRLSPLVREGKKLGVALIIVGKVKKITYRVKGDEVGLFRKKSSVAAVDVEMRMFDVQNGKEVIFDEKSADSQSSQLNLFRDEDSDDPKSQRLELVKMAVRNGMHMFSIDASRALEKISWEGRIAKISGGRVFINAGRATGLTVGDILKVMTPGEDVYDPVTGTYLGRSAGQPKGTLEVVDFLGADGAIASVHSGGNFNENDPVQLY
jgi:hypothetical protein